MSGRWILFFAFVPMAAFAAPKAAFTRGVSGAEVVSIDADVSGAERLALVVDDGGNGYAADWSDWIEPVLTGPQGETKLTEMKWSSATAAWGEVRIDRNAAGGELNAGGKQVRGIGTHATSVIEYDIAGKGFTRFLARAGGDKGGTDQGGVSVRFSVYALKKGEQLPSVIAKPSRGGAEEPEETLAGMAAAEGLEVSIFASEPMLANPTDIDIDAKGRVWVCEGRNYRKWKDTVPEGDRIVIVEDSDHDGKADKSTVFYQGPEINAALGICVLGNKAIVSCSPNVFVLYDDNGDDKADRKEVVFTGISGTQHDHGMHAFVFGPDGKLYFNFGNAGGQLMQPDGKPVVDLAGNEVSARGNPYRQGMVFRCDQDFSHVETLAWNFRNNYEVAVDSFGTLWQSDNDDDGNKSVRINYVMEFGNYGYSDEMTGAGWQQYRPDIEDEIPRRHWHQNDPGTIPNLLVTGAGSPTGIAIYEGDLFPEIFRNQIIHCDAGPRVVRAYPASGDGAGYKVTTEDILTARDSWFRPSDVGVMPDGSLIVADWYDPGVGGHNMGDNVPDKMHGRLYRVAPPGHRPAVPRLDLDTANGAAASLRSPNAATRFLAWTKLHDLGAAAIPALTEMAKKDRNPRMRARALWLLGSIPKEANTAVAIALEDRDENVRIAGIRIVREVGGNIAKTVSELCRDSSSGVRRECAIALRFCKHAEAPALWAELASRYDGKDRWYLEALGIGADLNWSACLDEWLKKVGSKWNAPASRDIIWRSRCDRTPDKLATLMLDPSIPASEKPRYLRALDFQKTGPEKDAALLRLLASPFAAEASSRLSFHDTKGHEEEIGRALESVKDTVQFVDLLRHFNIGGHDAELVGMALGLGAKPDTSASIAAARLLIATDRLGLLTDALRGEKAPAALRALGLANDRRALPALESLVAAAGAAEPLRLAAIDALAQIEAGAERLLAMAKEDKLDTVIKAASLQTLRLSQWPDIRAEVKKYAPPPPANPLPGIPELLKFPGDAARGQALFMGVCSMCHQINGLGVDYGPALSEIGTKLGKDALFDAVLNPSAGISFGFETIHLRFKSGDTAIGILVGETADDVVLKSIGGAITKYSRKVVVAREKLKVSSMPEIGASLPAAQLADLVEFLSTLKKRQ